MDYEEQGWRDARERGWVPRPMERGGRDSLGGLGGYGYSDGPHMRASRAREEQDMRWIREAEAEDETRDAERQDAFEDALGHPRWR